MEFWQDKTVLVTGASGLLGSALTKELLKRKSNVVCLLRDWVPESELLQKENVSKVNIVNGSVTNQKLIERILGEYEIETVFHLAAQTIVNVANNNPVSTFESNIKGTWTVLEACRRSPTVTGIVVASSDKAYGSQELPYRETMPLMGTYPYDVSKSCADMIAQSYAKTYDLPVSITRCANFYGGGDLNWNRIIPGTIRSILQKQTVIIRSDGKTVRDYLYIEDAVNGYMTIAEHLTKNPTRIRGEAFNISTESPISTLDLVNKIRGIMESDIPVDIQNRTTHEIQEQWLTSAKALKILNWYPRFSIFQGLKRTIEWYTKFLK